MDDSSKCVPVSISMPIDLAHKARVQAAVEDKSRSQLVCEALERTLKTTKSDGNVGPPAGAGTMEVAL